MADKSLLGVAPILGEKAKVYYDTVFTTTHLGRITDLVAAKLRSPTVHEFRLRALLLHLMFEAYRRCAPETLGEDSAHPLTRLETPLSVECGVLTDKLAFSVSFPLDLADPAFKAIQDGSFTPETSPALAGFLLKLHGFCNQSIVRAYEDSSTIEIVAVLEFSAERAGLEETTPLDSMAACEWIAAAAAKGADSKDYVQLADLEYADLLKNDDLGKGQRKPKLGELLATAAAEAELDSSRVSKELKDHERGKNTGSDDPEDIESKRVVGIEDDAGLRKVDGLAEEEGGLKKVSGRVEEVDSSVRKVSGGDEDEDTQTVRFKKTVEAPKKGWRSLFGRQGKATEESIEGGSTIESRPSGPSAGGDLAFEKAAAYEAQIMAMRQTISRLEAQAASEVRLVRGATGAVEPAAIAGDYGRGIAKPTSDDSDDSLLAAMPVDSEAPVLSDQSEEDDEEENIIQKIIKKLFGDKKKEGAPVGVPQGGELPNPELAAGGSATDSPASGVMSELELGKLEARVKRAQQEALALESKDPKAKRLIDGLMTDVMAEKGRLQELMKKANLTVRQKEIEFRNKEVQIKEEMRKKDEVLRQKDYALERNKEQVIQLTAQIEKVRAGAKGGGEEGSSHQKLLHTQKILAGAKEENRALAVKMDEFKKQVITMQIHARSRGAAGQEFTAIQSKYEKAARQMEEFKRANQQLVERLNKAEEKGRLGGQAGGGEDARKRLEASMRQLTLTKRESERLAGKVAEMQREDMRLRAEVTRLTTDLKRANKNSLPAMNSAAAAPSVARPPVPKSGRGVISAQPPPATATQTAPTVNAAPPVSGEDTKKKDVA